MSASGRSYLEDQTQAAIVQYCERVLDSDDYQIVSTPNGAYFGAEDGESRKAQKTFFDIGAEDRRRRARAAAGRQMARLKRTGLRPGFPDLTLWGPPPFVALIETKSDIGRLSPDQQWWRDWFLAHGYRWRIVRSTDDMRAALTEWNVPTREHAHAV